MSHDSTLWSHDLSVLPPQLLSVSGNQDLCYYNTLCSHPWYIDSSNTIIAFNNIFSNIGYLVLGVLVILLAYRRWVWYRVTAM